MDAVKEKTAWQKRKEYRIANSQCIHCGRITRNLDPKNHLCLRCRDKRDEAYLNWLEKQSDEYLAKRDENYNKSKRETYAMRKANHQCTKCGVDLDPADPRTYCEACREKDRIKSMRRHKTNPFYQRFRDVKPKKAKAVKPPKAVKQPKAAELPKVVEPPREPSPEELRIKENAERMRAEKRMVKAQNKELAYIRMMDNMAVEAERRRQELAENRQDRLNNLAKYVSALRR